MISLVVRSLVVSGEISMV
ncbi:BnaC01g29840D [Brassica napus]|uniref:BnaC01g29840D protein n=1 Tax=Brassica napus TaxID=3708 RepID=A0A078GFR9_BRANA|nr:BnaC01g29840D [Brassica napus]